MNIKLLFTLRHFFIKDATEFLLPHFILSNDNKIIDELFGDESTIKIIGTLEGDCIYRKNDFAYAVMPMDNYPSPVLISKKLFTEKSIYSKVIHDQVNSFISALWYVKDNSVSIHNMISDFVEFRSVHVSTSFNFFTRCDGTFSDEYFTVDDLSRAKELLSKWVAICPNLNGTINIDDIHKKGIKDEGINTEELVKYEYNDLNRLERASILLDTARSNHFLPLKIAFYIPVFECLFIADSGGEAQQKVSERVAFYISDNMDERWRYFDAMKDAYSIRSKFFHGDKIPSKYTHEKMGIIASTIDEIARKVMIRIIEKDHAIFMYDSKKKNDFELYLSKLIFSPAGLPLEESGINRE